MFIKRRYKYFQQETEETLNNKAGTSVLTIDNSENVSTITENYLSDMETTTLVSSISLIAPHFYTSHNTIPNTPYQVGTIIVSVTSPACRNLTHFWDDYAQNDGYDSDGKIGPLCDALKEEGEQYYDKDDKIPERYYN